MTLPVPYSGSPIYNGPEVQIGDVRVDGVAIYTPVGVWPIRGSRWMIISQPIPITTTAGWGIGLAVTCAVIAVVFSIFTCGLSLFLLLGLLFLTARTTAMSGPLVVSIQSGPYHYMAQELVYSPLHAAQAIQRVNFAQALAAR
ncbi:MULTISPECIES: hypothetical protein [Dactylosporangium]|uniref:Uncharacterized protein n=2 Tax=Dactylosporangium TaxID=35753 RepID=A0A9W6NM34_9ACTN|nr:MULTISPECIES: hypothetical protein [Dactylosporangium]UAB94919.1 hypothetical protein Dvina_43730 [Dactylosporangium vinaceum]UWZ43289.1 hypothetical protein Dmats_38330 [Dactylosporangium matsuzakiense]GLL02605.1 hypothetical protein GCM10017581_043470 [Dactylosporangium matsuzakiense]